MLVANRLGADPHRAYPVIDGKDMHPFAIKAWKAAIPYSLLKDILDRLKAWKSMVLSGAFEHFNEPYHELLNILGYLALDAEDPNH
jgi:hypothetical protein